MRWMYTIALAVVLLFAAETSGSARPAEPRQYAQAPVHVVPRVHIQMAQQQQHQAREAYKRGEIKSFSVIRQRVITTYDGKVISTQFVQHSQGKVRYVYKFRILSPDGTVRVVHVNAQNANIINVKGKP